MKLMTLNIWGGQITQPLLDFLKSHQEVDIFCLQEVYHNAKERVADDESPVNLNIFSEIQKMLPDHVGYFRPVVDNAYGIGMFVKKGVKVLEEGEVLIHENENYPGKGPTHQRNLQWLQCCVNEQNYSVMNVHGLWNGKGKLDSPERISQSKKIRDFLEEGDSQKILCGDFNLRPDTDSVKILEERMENLIDKYQVKSTRTSFYPKEEKFADYIFTSPELTVRHFEVMKDEVSDHAPLLLEFGV